MLKKNKTRWIFFPTCTIVDALVVDELPVLWFDRIGAENPPVHDDVWSSDVVHVEAGGRKYIQLLKNIPSPDQR